MKKKIRIFALLLVVAMLLSAFAYAHEETDSAKIHLTGETLSEADDVQAREHRIHDHRMERKRCPSDRRVRDSPFR